jgi:hypothetical protein
MMRRPLLRCAALLVCLAFLLPLGAAADSCEDCLGGAASPACCPLPSCCSACAHSPSLLAAPVWGAERPAPSFIETVAPPDRALSSPPRDIFHVPKPRLAA